MENTLHGQFWIAEIRRVLQNYVNGGWPIFQYLRDAGRRRQNSRFLGDVVWATQQLTSRSTVTGMQSLHKKFYRVRSSG